MNRKVWTLVALLALAVLLAGASLAGSAEKPKHRKVGHGKDCIACHQKLTKKVYAEWYASPHGLNNVKCFVCHGSTGDDFTLEPSMDRCIGCHADQVASMSAPEMDGKNCFSCHPSHRLNPHGAGM